MFNLNATIEFAKSSDAAEIATLSRDYIEYGLRWKYTPERLRALMAKPTKNVVVARKGERLLGFGIMTYRNDDANLDLLAVRRRYRRRGAGRQIVEWLIEVALEAGVSSVYVQVRKLNTGAIRFYQKLSFEMIDEISGYYQGEETGAIFCKTLRPVFTAT